MRLKLHFISHAKYADCSFLLVSDGSEKYTVFFNTTENKFGTSPRSLDKIVPEYQIAKPLHNYLC
jgi:hypothetical protein